MKTKKTYQLKNKINKITKCCHAIYKTKLAQYASTAQQQSANSRFKPCILRQADPECRAFLQWDRCTAGCHRSQWTTIQWLHAHIPPAPAWTRAATIHTFFTTSDSIWGKNSRAETVSNSYLNVSNYSLRLALLTFWQQLMLLRSLERFLFATNRSKKDSSGCQHFCLTGKFSLKLFLVNLGPQKYIFRSSFNRTFYTLCAFSVARIMRSNFINSSSSNMHSDTKLNIETTEI